MENKLTPHPLQMFKIYQSYIILYFFGRGGVAIYLSLVYPHVPAHLRCGRKKRLLILSSVLNLFLSSLQEKVQLHRKLQSYKKSPYTKSYFIK